MHESGVSIHHVGLDNLRELANQGLATVVPYTMPVTAQYIAAHQLLAAGPIVYTNPHSTSKNLTGN